MEIQKVRHLSLTVPVPIYSFNDAFISLSFVLSFYPVKQFTQGQPTEISLTSRDFFYISLFAAHHKLTREILLSQQYLAFYLIQSVVRQGCTDDLPVMAL